MLPSPSLTDHLPPETVTSSIRQHTLDPCTDLTVPSGGKAYLVKAVQARASEVSHDLVGRKEPFPQECLGEVYNQAPHWEVVPSPDRLTAT